MRLLKGLGSLALMVFVLVGVPTLLWLLGGNPLPTELPSMDLLTKPTEIGLFISVATFVGWFAWATLAWAILVEIYAALRGVTIRPPKALEWQHGSARNLVGGVMLLGAIGSQIGGTAIAGAAPASGPELTGTQYVAGQDSAIQSSTATDVSPTASKPAQPSKPVSITTESGDTLWDLAEKHLGDGHRWTEIRDLNESVADSVFLPVGATLTLPAVATNPAPGQITVVEGDCLWDLAEKHLGDGHRWTEIRDANPDTVHGQGSLIYIGSHLTIRDIAATTQDASPTTPEVPEQDAAEAVPEQQLDEPTVDATLPEERTEQSEPKDSAGRHGLNAEVEQNPEPALPLEQSAPSAEESEGAGTAAGERAAVDRDGRHAESAQSTPADPAPAPSAEEAPEQSFPSAEESPEQSSPSAEESEGAGTAAGERAAVDRDGRHAESAPAEPAHEQPEEATATGEVEPGVSHDPPVEVSESPTPEPAPAEGGDLAQSAEDQVAQILGALESGDAGEQSQELPPPPPPAAELPSADSSPTPPDPDQAPTPSPENPASKQASKPSAEAPAIEVVPVEPQTEAAPGSREAEKIAEQAAAAAAEYGLGAPRAVTPPSPATPTHAPQSVVVAEPAPAATTLDERTSRIAGLSVVALLGLISVLQVYRRRQQHDRRRGEAIALPVADAGEVLTEANASVDPVVLSDVDRVLRHLDDSTRYLDSVPRIVGVTVTGQSVDVAVAADLDLPEPWSLVEGAWSVEPRSLPDAPHSLVSPWPSLVPVGTTPAGDPFLLNLEDVGSLAVSAQEPDLARHIMQAMAVELAVSPISDGDLHVHLVGLAEDLPAAIDSGRLERCDDIDELLDRMEKQKREHETALAADGLDSADHARRAWSNSDFTAPHVVLCATELSEEQLSRLGELTHSPRFAAAAVTSQPQPVAGGWVLDVANASAARLHTGDGGGLEIVPAPLTDRDLAAVVSVLETAQRPSVPVTVPTEDDVLEETNADQQRESGFGGIDPLETVPVSLEGMWAAEEVENSLVDTAPMPRLVDPLTEAATGTGAETEEATLASSASPATEASHIWLHLLGEPKITPIGGQEAPSSREARLTELAMLLHLEGELTHTQIDERLWPRDPHDRITDPSERARRMKDRRQQFFSRLRAWMGETSEGEEAFPKVGGRHSDVRYHLHSEVTSDWQRWCQLVPRLAYEASTEDLAEAMALVRGTPLARPSARVTTYGWADDHRQNMISRLTDAAEELAARQITEGSVAAALKTALLGLDVCTAREGLWRMAIISTHGLGGPSSREQTQQLIDRMLTEMTELEVELETETTELLAHLDQLHTDTGDPLYEISAEAS